MTGGTGLGRSHTPVDSECIRREEGIRSGGNPFQTALHVTIPIWMNDYDEDGTGFVYQEGHVPLYKIDSFEELTEFIGLLDPWMKSLLMFNRDRFYMCSCFPRNDLSLQEGSSIELTSSRLRCPGTRLLCLLLLMRFNC